MGFMKTEFGGVAKKFLFALILICLASINTAYASGYGALLSKLTKQALKLASSKSAKKAGKTAIDYFSDLFNNNTNIAKIGNRPKLNKGEVSANVRNWTLSPSGNLTKDDIDSIAKTLKSLDQNRDQSISIKIDNKNQIITTTQTGTVNINNVQGGQGGVTINITPNTPSTEPTQPTPTTPKSTDLQFDVIENKEGVVSLLIKNKGKDLIAITNGWVSSYISEGPIFSSVLDIRTPIPIKSGEENVLNLKVFAGVPNVQSSKKPSANERYKCRVGVKYNQIGRIEEYLSEEFSCSIQEDTKYLLELMTSGNLYKSQNSIGANQHIQREVSEINKNVTVNGTGNTVIQVSNNIIVKTTDNDKPLHMRSFTVHKLKLNMTHSKHVVEYFKLSADTPLFSLERINKFIETKTRAIYADHKQYDEVNIKLSPKFLEFGLVGVDIDIFLDWRHSAHPLEKSGGFVLNQETGEPFEFKDLFRSGYAKKLNPMVIEQLKSKNCYLSCEEKKELTAINELQDSIEKGMAAVLGYYPNICFSSVEDNTKFHLTPDALILKYSRYEIAGGVN